jgi:hypothetical protein
MLAVVICRTSCITSLAQRALEVRCRRICSPWQRTSLARPGSSKLRSLPPFLRNHLGATQRKNGGSLAPKQQQAHDIKVGE